MVPVSTRQKARAGKGVLPPNPKQWGNEHNGLDLREELDVRADLPLPHDDAFALFENVAILAHGALGAEQRHVDHLRTNSRVWAGAAIPREDGSVIVLYNDAHDIARIRSTLMEEFFHLRLGHRPSKIKLLELKRTHDAKIENEAFGSGAAALVPYAPLKALVHRGTHATEIAAQFQVSVPLVVFQRSWRTKLHTDLRREGRGEVPSERLASTLHQLVRRGSVLIKLEPQGILAARRHDQPSR
jgi:hypothetical protein